MSKKKIIIIAIAAWLAISVVIALVYIVSYVAANPESAIKIEGQTDTDETDTAEPDVSESDDIQDLRDSLKEDYDIGSPLPVNDDTTGNWHMVTIYSAAKPEDYALDYFKAYFETEDPTEVHIIVNLGTKTTTSIRRLVGDTLVIDVYEYVDGEETSAKTLGKGTHLKSFSLDTDTGVIEDLGV